MDDSSASIANMLNSVNFNRSMASSDLNNSTKTSGLGTDSSLADKSGVNAANQSFNQSLNNSVLDQSSFLDSSSTTVGIHNSSVYLKSKCTLESAISARPVKPAYCKRCPARVQYTSLLEMVVHVDTGHRTNIYYQCPHCSFNDILRSMVTAHLHAMHPTVMQYDHKSTPILLFSDITLRQGLEVHLPLCFPDYKKDLLDFLKKLFSDQDLVMHFINIREDIKRAVKKKRENVSTPKRRKGPLRLKDDAKTPDLRKALTMKGARRPNALMELQVQAPSYDIKTEPQDVNASFPGRGLHSQALPPIPQFLPNQNSLTKSTDGGALNVANPVAVSSLISESRARNPSVYYSQLPMQNSTHLGSPMGSFVQSSTVSHHASNSTPLPQIPTALPSNMRMVNTNENYMPMFSNQVVFGTPQFPFMNCPMGSVPGQMYTMQMPMGNVPNNLYPPAPFQISSIPASPKMPMFNPAMMQPMPNYPQMFGMNMPKHQ